MRVLIVDDEPIAREGLRLHLAGEDGVEVVGECSNGREAIAAIRDLKPDLVLLDVRMPLLDGFGVVREIGPAQMPLVVFVTAHDEYALRAFDAHALDYVLKPVDGERLRAALARAEKRLAASAPPVEQTRQLLALLGGLARAAAPKYLERVAVRTPERVVLVELGEVEWIESQGNYVRLHAGRDKHLVRETMDKMESLLDPERFLRVRRSAIVRIAAVRELRPLFNGEYELLLAGGARLTSSRRYRRNLDRVLKH